MRILCDYDGVLARTDEARYRVMNNQFITDYKPELQTHWNNQESGYLDQKHDDYFWKVIWPLEAFHHDLFPVEGAIDGVLSLIERGHQVMIVSDRNPQLFEVTRDWLDRQGLDMVRLLFTTHKHSMNTDTKGMLTKAQAAYLYKLDTVIEDAPHHAEAMSNRSYVDRVFLLNYPYNSRIEMKDKITRVSGWKELLTHVK